MKTVCLLAGVAMLALPAGTADATTGSSLTVHALSSTCDNNREYLKNGKFRQSPIVVVSCADISPAPVTNLCPAGQNYATARTAKREPIVVVSCADREKKKQREIVITARLR